MQQSCCRRAPRVTQAYVHTSAHNYPRSLTIFSTCRHISGGSCAAPAPQTVILYRSSTGTMTSSHSVCSLAPSLPLPISAPFTHVEVAVKGQRLATAPSHSRARFKRSHTDARTARRGHGTRLQTHTESKNKQTQGDRIVNLLDRGHAAPKAT